MAQFKNRIHSFISGCFAFIASLTFDSFSMSRALRVLRRAVEYVAKAAAHQITPVKAEWRIVERTLSEIVREKINVFGWHPRNTGALCSPLL